MNRTAHIPPSIFACLSPEVLNHISSQELKIVAAQNKLLIIRYSLSTGIMERFYDANDLWATPNVKGERPRDLIAHGLVHPDDIDCYSQFFANMRAGIASGTTEARFKIPDGAFHWHKMHYSLVYDEGDKPTHALITCFDNSEQREMQLAHEKWKSSFAVLLAESMHYMEANLSRNKVERQEGRSFLQREGKAASNLEAFLTYGVQHVVHPEDREEYKHFFNRRRFLSLFTAGVMEDSIIYRGCPPEKDYIWLRANVRMTQYPACDDITIIIAYEDIDQQHRELESLALQASRDSLTGVLNRGAMQKEITDRLQKLDEENMAALFIVDLDNFKQINDTLGHKKGDDVLMQAADALNKVFGQMGIVGRLGGDEFMAFLSGNLRKKDMELLAAKAIHALQFTTGGDNPLHASASVGIAVRKGREDFESLYSRADNALYAAKNSGKCQFRIFADTQTQKQSQPTEDYGRLGPLPLQSIMEHLGGGLAVAKMSGHNWQEIEIAYMSPSFSRNLNYPSHVSDGNKGQLLRFIVKQDLPGLVAAMRKTALTEMPTEFLYRVQMPHTPKIAWRNIHITSMPSGREDYRLIVGHVSDVTSLVEKFHMLERNVQELQPLAYADRDDLQKQA